MIDTLDLACVELQAISDDIVSGCKAYHNACVVVRDITTVTAIRNTFVN